MVPSVRLPVSPKALRARCNISSEALRVNVRSHDPGGIDPLRHEPSHPRRKSFGLARAGSGNGKHWALARVAARSCSGFRSSIRDSGIPLEDTCRQARRPATEGKVEVRWRKEDRRQRFYQCRRQVSKEAVGIHVLLTRSLFGGGILRRLLLRVSPVNSTSAPWRC